MKIEITNRYTGLVLYSCEADSIKQAVEQAVKEKVSLEGADLTGADFLNSNLKGVELRDSSLVYAKLKNADLTSAKLVCADLRYANLRCANLTGVNLDGCNLTGAKLSESQLTGLRPMFCKWDVSFKGDTIQIGCEEKTVEQWKKWFSSDKEFETKRDTEEFVRIQAMYEAIKAYKKTMDKFKNN